MEQTRSYTPAERLMLAIRAQGRALAQAQQEASRRAAKASSRPRVVKPATRYLHVSKVYPANPNYGKAMPNGAIDTVPFLTLPGRTFSVGRNAAKRERRARGLQ